MARVFLLQGDREQALLRLEQAYEDRDFWLLYLLRHEPELLEPLRSDPRFQRLLGRVPAPPPARPAP